MSRAYVLMNAKNQDRVKEVVSHIAKKKGVKLTDAIFGPYDIIAVIEGQDLKNLSDTIINNLYDVGNIESSTTCIAIE